jgi:hypothetical protein
MKTTITVGQSVQVFNIGQPEYWNKITISKEFEDISNEQVQIDLLMEEVKLAHEKHSKSVEVVHTPTGDLYFNVTKNKEERG